jgi:lactoylglutathione lyase
MNIIENVTGIQHIGIPTNNIDTTIEFYKRLGFCITYQTIIDGTSVVFLNLHNITIEAYQNGQASMTLGAIDHIALNVSDIDEALNYAVNKDFNILEESIRFLPFFKNGVRFFTIEGPNNEKVEFNQIL